MCFTSYIFSWKLVCFISIILSQIILSIIPAKYFAFSYLHLAGLQAFHIHKYFYTQVDICYSTINLNYIFPPQIYICIHILYALLKFIPIIMWNMLRFKSSILFAIHTLLDKSFKVLQLLTHLSNLTANG